jgi:hypothetical protein
MLMISRVIRIPHEPPTVVCNMHVQISCMMEVGNFIGRRGPADFSSGMELRLDFSQEGSCGSKDTIKSTREQEALVLGYRRETRPSEIQEKGKIKMLLKCFACLQKLIASSIIAIELISCGIITSVLMLMISRVIR